MKGYMRSASFKDSLGYALKGIAYAAKNERNMQIDLVAAVLAMAAAFYLEFQPLEWALLSITVFGVLAAEVVNTAVERTVDMFTSEYNSLAKRAKNLAAGAVLLAALNSLVVAACLFGPRLWMLVKSNL